MATNIRVGVQLETDAAKQQIADLTASLKNIGKINFDTGFIKTELMEADRAAQQLQTHLNAAVDVKTGNLNLAAFQKSLQTAGTDLGTLMTKIQAAGPAGQQAFGQLATAIATARAPIKQLNGALGSMWTTLKNTAKWQLSSSMIHGFMSAIQGATSYAKELNSALTDIRIVTGQSIDQMTKFTEKAHQAAQALSTSTKEYAKASLIYYQQGLSDSDVEKRAALTVKAANASFESNTKEMSQMLTAVWNSYQAGADQLQSYVDVMASLGATTASSMEEIATAMQKVAATANMVGVSMQQMSSIVATVADTTRTAPEQIGTAYKTILARIGDLKLGETLEDGVGLGTVSTSLKKIGVDILDATGELRDMGTVIEEIGQKWQTMNKSQQTALAQQLGGKRQYTSLVALFENMDKYYKNMETAANSNGALDKMQETYASGWEAASTRVKTAMEGIYNQLIDDQAIIKITDGFSGFLNLISDLVKGMGGLNGVLSAMGSIVTGIFADKAFASIRQLGTDLKTIFSNPVNTTATMLRDNADDLKKAASQDPNATRSEITKQTAELATSRAMMLEKSKMMTETERTQSEGQLNQISTMIQKTNELGAAYEENSKRADIAGQKLSASLGDISTQMKSMKSTISGSGTSASGLLDLLVGDASKSGQWMATTDNVLLAWRKLQDIEQSGQSAIRLSLELDNYKDAEDKVSRMKIAIESLQKATAGTKIDLSSLINLDENALKNMSGKDFAAAINKVFNNMDMSQITKLNTVFTNIFDGMIEKAKDPALSQMWDAFKNGAQLSSEELDALATHLGMTREQLEKYKKSLELIGNSVGDRIATGVMKTASGLMALNSTMTATTTLVTNIQRGTLNFSNGLGSVASMALMGVRSVTMFSQALQTTFKGMSSAAAGWIGVAITVLTTVISAISNAQTEAQKIAAENAKKAEEAENKAVKQHAESTSSYAKLVATFTSLYSEYETTGEVTQTFADAARNLADNLDDSTAKLLLLSGHYKDFMSYIKDSSVNTFQESAKTYETARDNLTNNQIVFTNDNNNFTSWTKLTPGHDMDGTFADYSNGTAADRGTTFTYATGQTIDATDLIRNGVAPDVVTARGFDKNYDQGYWVPFASRNRLKGTIKFQGVDDEWDDIVTALSDPKYAALQPYFAQNSDDIFINTEDMFATYENLQLFDEWVTEATGKGIIQTNTDMGRNLMEMQKQIGTRLDTLTKAKESVSNAMSAIWATQLMGIDDSTMTSWEAYDQWTNDNIYNSPQWQRYVDIVHGGDTNAAKTAFSLNAQTYGGTNFKKWNAVSGTYHADRNKADPGTLLTDNWKTAFRDVGGVSSRLTASDALMLNSIDPNSELGQQYLAYYRDPNSSVITAMTEHGKVTEAKTGWGQAKTVAAKQALFNNAVGTNLTTGGMVITADNDALAQAVLNAQEITTAMTEADARAEDYENTMALVGEEGLARISSHYNPNENIIIQNGQKEEIGRYTAADLQAEYGEYTKLMTLSKGLIEKDNETGNYVLTELGKQSENAEKYQAYLDNVNAAGVGDSLTSGVITAPEEFLRYSTNESIRKGMAGYIAHPENYTRTGAAIGWVLSEDNGMNLTADNKEAIAAMKERTRTRNAAAIAGANVATQLTDLPTSAEDWGALYTAYGNYLEGETIDQFMALNKSQLGERLRTSARNDIETTEALESGTYVSYSTLLHMMAKEQAGNQDVDDWLASEEGQEWLATQDADSLYAYALKHDYTGDILSDAEAAARSKSNAGILTSAFDLENANTISKLSQIQNLVSAITTDISNMRAGKGLSQGTANLLELMGIDPDSINTVEELENVLTDLQDEKKENSLPSLMNKLKASAKDQYGIDFDNVTQAQVDAWSISDNAEDQRKLALYKKWLEYKQQEYQLDQAIDQIEKTQRDNREQTKLNKWQEELTKLNKEAEKAKTNYENLANAIEHGTLTKSQRSTLGADLARDWDAAKTSADRAKVALTAAYESTIKQQKAIEEQQAAIARFSKKDATNQYAHIQPGRAYSRDTDENGHELNRFKANWQDESSFIENIFGKNLSNAETAILSEAYQATVKIVPQWAEDPKAFMEQFYKELERLSQDYGEQSDTLMAQLADNVNNLYSNLGAQEQAAAAKMVSAWTSAFQQIKSIRQTILSGGDQMELIAGDPAKAIAMWAGYSAKNSGKTTTDFLVAAANNSLGIDNYNYATDWGATYLTRVKSAYGLNFLPTKGENGYDRDTLYTSIAQNQLGGLTYNANASDQWKWHAPTAEGEEGYFTRGTEEKHYTLAEMKSQELGPEAIASYMTPFLTAGLEQAESAGILALESGDTKYNSIQDLVYDAVVNNNADAWDLITSNLANVEGGLTAFSNAVQIAAASTEALSKAQKAAKDEVENQYDIGKNASSQNRIAAAMAAYAADTSGQDWATFAVGQGLTPAEIAAAGTVTHKGASKAARDRYGSTAKLYDNAAKAIWTEMSSSLIEDATGDIVIDGKTYKIKTDANGNPVIDRTAIDAMMTDRSNYQQQAASARASKQQEIDAEEARKQARIQTRRQAITDVAQRKVNAQSALQTGAESFYRTGVLDAATREALLAAGIDPNTITDWTSYQTQMNNLSGAKQKYADQLRKNLINGASDNGVYINRTNFTGYENKSFLDWVDQFEAGSDAYNWALTQKDAFESWQTAARAANAAQTELSASAIKMGVDIENAMKKATKETTKLEKEYNKVSGLSSALSNKLQKGVIDERTRQQLRSAGLLDSWTGKTNVQGRAEVMMQARGIEGIRQAALVRRQNAAILGEDTVNKKYGYAHFFGTGAAENAADSMKQAFLNAWTEGENGSRSNLDTWFKNLISKDAFKELSEEAKSAMESIWSNLDISSEDTPDQIWAKFISACQEAEGVAKEAITEITTSMLSDWQSALEGIIGATQAAAAEVVAIWAQAFATLGKMYEAVFSGKTIGDALESEEDYAAAVGLLGATSLEDLDTKLQQRDAEGQATVEGATLPGITGKDLSTAKHGVLAYATYRNGDSTFTEDITNGATLKAAVLGNEEFKKLDASAFIAQMSEDERKALGITAKEDGTGYLDNEGHEITGTAAAFAETLNWDEIYKAGLGTQMKHLMDVRKRNASIVSQRMTGGALTSDVSWMARGAEEATTVKTLSELERLYGEKWQDGDEELLKKAGGTKRRDWKSEKEGGKFTDAELDRLAALGVTNSAQARAAKTEYNTDTTTLNTNRSATAEAEAGKIKTTTTPEGKTKYYDSSEPLRAEAGDGDIAVYGEDGSTILGYAKEILPAAVEEINTQLESIQTAAEDAANTLSDPFDDALQDAADALGVERNALGQAVEDIYALNGATLDWISLSKEEQVHAATVAEEWQKQADALDALGKALTKKTGAFAVIEDETKSIKEQTAAYETLRDAVNNYFHDNEVGVDFVKQNYEDIKEWANGSLEAMERVEKAVLKQQLEKMLKKQGKAVEDFADQLNDLNEIGNKLKFGDKLNKIDMAKLMKIQRILGLTNEEMIELADSMGLALDYEKEMTGQELVDAMGVSEAAQYAADQGMQLAFDKTSQQYVLVNVDADTSAAEEAIGELGDETIETEEHVSINADQMNIGTETVSASGGTSDSADADIEVDPGGSAHVHKEGEMEMEAETTVPVIESSGGGKGQTVKAPQATKTRDNSTPQKPGGGGGGGGKKTQKKKSYSDIKRYHEVDQSLQAYENRINKIAKKEEMAFGADRVKLMKERMKELNKEMDAYQEKLNEATAYEKKDKANLQKAADQLGFKFEFDENGTITNWEKWQETLIDWYNKHKDDEPEDGMESAEDVYKRLQQLSEDYEDSVKTRQEMEEKILEQLHKQSELYAEIIQESHQWKLDLQDLKLTLLEGQLQRMDDTLGNMGDKAKLMSEALFGADGVGLDGTGMDKLNELLELQNEIASAKTDQESIKNGEGMDEATKAEKLQEIMQQVNDQMNDLWSKGQEIQQLYGEMWSKYDEELQQNAGYISNNIALVQTFAKVLELAWRSTDYDALGKFYQKQLDYANKELELYSSSRDTIMAEKERFDEEIAAAGGLENLDEQRQKDYKDLVARLQEADNNLMQATQDVLEAAAQVYQNEVNKAITKLDNTLAMGMDDLEYLQQQYDRYTETQERYLNTAHQLYNVNKLNRQIEGAMADTNNKALRDQYEALQNVINEKAKSGKLTQYDVDMMQKQYELLEKQAALKDAQNAKDTVRLTRDENGNYMYQYTADQDKIDEATQAYDDVLIQINELSTQRVSELEAEMLEKRKWYVEQARAIAEDETLTEEQKQERLTELRRQAAEDDIYFQEQMGIAYDNLQINGETCFDRWGDVIQAVFNDPTEGINPTIKAAIENEENMADALGEAIDAIIPKLQELGRIQDQTLNRTGLEDPSEYFDSMAEETKLAMTETSKLNDKLAEQATKINEVTQEWYKQKEVLKDLFATIEAANTENLQLLWQLGNNDTDIADPSSTGTIQYRLVPVRNSSAHSTDGHAKGGLVDYTGYHWLDGSITQPELVLSAADTANMLQTVDILHNIDVASVQNLLALLSGLAAAMSGGGISAGMANIITGSGAMEQDVHITAEFPNATDKAEIMAAFDELNNRASQYANRNRK